jgi:uncharacterized membrane protein
MKADPDIYINLKKNKNLTSFSLKSRVSSPIIIIIIIIIIIQFLLYESNQARERYFLKFEIHFLNKYQNTGLGWCSDKITSLPFYFIASINLILFLKYIF